MFFLKVDLNCFDDRKLFSILFPFQKLVDEEFTAKVAKPSGCNTNPSKVEVVRPRGLWESEMKEPSSKTNMNGKRVMETTAASLNDHQKNRVFANYVLPNHIDRPSALSCLKARKAVYKPQAADELPSPSAEFSKLSFTPSPGVELSASNPFFPSCSTSAIRLPSPTASLSAENPSFQGPESFQKGMLGNGDNERFPFFYDCYSHCSKRINCLSSSTTLETSLASRSSLLNSLASAPPMLNASPLSNSSVKSRSEYECQQDSPESGFVDNVEDYSGKSIAVNQVKFPKEPDPYRDADRESLGSTGSLEIIVK